MKANGAKLRSRTAKLQKKFTKLIADFDSDAALLGLDVSALTPVAASADAMKSALDTVLFTAKKMTQGKELAAADVARVNMRAAGNSPLGKKIAKLSALKAAEIEKEAEKEAGAGAQRQAEPFKIEPRTAAQKQARADKVASRQAEPFKIEPRTAAQKQARAAKIANRKTQAQGSAPLDTPSPQSAKDKIRKAVKKKVGARGAARRTAAKLRQRKGLEEHIIQKIVDMLVEKFK